MKLCVFQGTFNPIHKAHINLAKYITNKYDFDKFLFIPAYRPPHKEYNPELSLHRLNMVKLAIENYSNFEVSDIEYQREGKSYTYLTICELYKLYNIEDKIHFIIGTDAFDDIESWYKIDKLKKLIKFIVFIREEKFNPNKYNCLKEKGYNFEIEQLPYENISSSEIRNMIENNQNTEKYLDKKVRTYIEKNDLYKN